MQRFIAAAIAAVVFVETTGCAFAFDPSSGQSWQRPTRAAAVAYFRLPFHPTESHDRVAYGLALTAPTLGGYGSVPLPIADAPKLLDLRFNGAVPDSLRVTGQVAWTQNPSQVPEDQRLNLFGGLGGFALGIVGTAAAAYGIYSVLKKKCPAISTTTGGCVKSGS